VAPVRLGLSMPLEPQLDVAAADWFAHADADWADLVGYGPPGFEAYARVPFDLDDDSPVNPDVRVMQAALDLLEQHTATPESIYVGVWHGWGVWEDDVHPRAPRAPRFAVPHREYVLLAGNLVEALTLESLGIDYPATPHLLWPADHAWFIASDVDPDWFGVGASQVAVDDLVSHEAINAVPVPYGATP
jgi:hypothetical protein